MSEEMKKIRWSMSIGLVGCRREGEFEIEADATPDDVDEIVQEQVFQIIETSWEMVE